MTAPLMPADRVVEFTVYGDPAPQGSKTAVYRWSAAQRRNVPTGAMRESGGHRLERWRDAVKAGAFMQSRGRVLFPGPVFVRATITVKRPKTGPWAGAAWPGGEPDLDKLQRAIGDALTQGKLIGDDALIVGWDARKVYPGQPWPMALDRPGAWIRVWEAE